MGDGPADEAPGVDSEDSILSGARDFLERMSPRHNEDLERMVIHKH